MPQHREGEGAPEAVPPAPLARTTVGMEDLLIEMRVEHDVKLKKINKLQQQFEELTRTVKRRLI